MRDRSTSGPLSRLARRAWGFVLAAGVLSLSLQCATVNALPEGNGSEKGVPATLEQASAPLIQKQDLVYTGAFRVPAPLNDRQTYAWGGTSVAYWPAHDSLLMVGHDWYQQVGEMSIPTPGGGSTVEDLPRADDIQPLTDVLQGKLKTIDGDIQNGVKIGGIIVTPQSLVVTAWSYYDAGPQKQTKTHFVTGQNFATLTPASVTGPFQVGTGFQNVIRGDSSRIAGFVSGYMTPIPKDWQAALGGTHLTGQGGGISILMRTSAGPSASVFTPADLGAKVPAPAKIVMGYPIDTSDPSSGLHHPELGEWGSNGGLYNGTQAFRGMVFPEGTRSVLFIGFGADNFCYGSGTADKSLHLRPVPGAPGVHYCYDPTPGMVGNKGTHGYPISPIVWAYDVNEFLQVKNGDKQPWDVKPYATWELALPFQSNMQNGIEMGNFEIMGAAYDPVRRRLFVSAYRNDGPAPIIHVFVLKSAITAE